MEISCSKATAGLLKHLGELPIEYAALEYGVNTPASDLATMGMSVVASWAACPAASPKVTIIAGRCATSSAASVGRRSTLPSAKRKSSRTFCPCLPIARLNWSLSTTTVALNNSKHSAISLAFAGIIPLTGLLVAIVTQWLVKSAYEALATPVTYLIVGFLKRIEGVDVYDRDTRFNPLLVAD